MDHAKELEKQRRQIPSNNPNDPRYRRLRYVRYADDFLLGFTGTKEEAAQIKQEVFFKESSDLSYPKKKPKLLMLEANQPDS